jgi:hypothetical protein
MKVLAATLVGLAMNIGTLSLAQEPQMATRDSDLASGMAQVRSGDLEQAVNTLTRAAYRLSLAKGRASDLARAYTYLAVAYLGLSRLQEARAGFLEAWKADPALTLSPEEFSSRVVDLFQETRREAEARDDGWRRRATPSPTPGHASGRGTTLALPLAGLAVGGVAGAVLKRSAASEPAAAATATRTPPSMAGTWALSENGDGGVDLATLAQSGQTVTGTLTRGFNNSPSDIMGTVSIEGAVVLHEQRRIDSGTCDFTGKVDSTVTIAGTEACSNGFGAAFELLKR